MDKLLSGKNAAYIALILVVLLWAAIFLPGLGSLELKGEEGRRVMPALDMIKSGQYLIPYIGGEPYFNKPPTINWIIIASVKIFNSTSEFVVRLPSPVSLLTLCLVVLYLPCRQVTLEFRFLACVIFLGCLGLATKGRLIEIDTVYVSQTAIACFWWFYRKLDNSSRWRMYFVPMLFLAFALLTKGPIALLVFYVLVICVSAKTRSWRDLFCYQHFICLLMAFAVFYCWYHAVDLAGYAELRDTRMQKEVGKRFSSFRFEPDRIIQEGISAVLNLMPWLIIMPVCWIKRFTDNIPDRQRSYYFALRLAFVISFIIIIFMPRTLGRYALPVVPLGLFLFAWVINYNKTLDHTDKTWRVVLFIFIPIITLASIVGVFAYEFSFTTVATSLAFIFVTCIVFYGKKLINCRVELTLLTAIVIAMGINLYYAFGSFILPPDNTSRKTAVHIESVVPENEVLYLCNPEYQLFIYYLKIDYLYISPEDIVSSDADCVLIRKEQFDSLPLLDSWHVLDEFNYREDRDFILIQRQ